MKKTSGGIAGLVLGLLSIVAAAGETGSLEVRVDGIRNDSGQVFVSLFNSDEGFPGDKALQTLQTRQADGRAVVTFENLPWGEYAVAAYHDEDGNGKMKTVYGSIPLEGIGISRDAKGVMGPPKFKDAKVELNSAAMTIDVHIKY